MKKIFKNIVKTDEDWKQVRIFLFLDFLYVSAVFLWVIFLPRSGSDYLWFHNTFVNQPIYGSDSFVLSMIFTFSSIVFRLVNFLLLYVLMVILFFTTRFFTGGPWWLGSLSAVLFMAHPLTQQQVVQLNGYETLASILINAILLLLFAYSVYTQNSRFIFIWLLSLIALFVAPLSAPFIIIIGFGFLLNKDIQGLDLKQYIGMSLLLMLPALYFLRINQSSYLFSLDFIPQFSLLVYPIGWLPITIKKYHWNSILPIFYGALSIFVLVFVAGKAKQKYLALLLGGIVFLCMFSHKNGVNLSQPLHNPSALFPLMLFCISVSWVCGIIQKHPRWKTSIVKATTLLCIIMMGCQIFLNGLYAYSSSQEQCIAQDILKQVEEKHIDEFILFPESIEYRWHKLNIYATLLKNKITSTSHVQKVKIFPYCVLRPDSVPDVELTAHRFSQNSLIVGIVPTYVEYWLIYPSEFVIPNNRETQVFFNQFFNPQNNTWVEFCKEEQTENVLIRADDKKLSTHLFLWDNKKSNYTLFTQN
ncbi:MAG TPA: hypothetical protein PLT82_02860 [Candidatus Hydrogenedens sp.]|nr:hypothetical protein [Candidatus Hydrogenedens sp.]HOL19401.1 hypothetical protein [Candidatus Hydrogenedens sp.]HPP58053.1 hypothetical protein [Candidatus Hydrogenedens sp.]